MSWDEEDRANSAPHSFTLFDVMNVDDANEILTSVTHAEKNKMNLIRKWKRRLEKEANNNNNLDDDSGKIGVLKPRNHIILSDKSFADVMEALIGCFLAHGGQRSALKVMAAMGIDLSILSDSSLDSSGYVASSAFQQWTKKPKDAVRPDADENTVRRGLSKLEHAVDAGKIEEVIGYSFVEKTWLYQAVTH